MQSRSLTRLTGALVVLGSILLSTRAQAIILYSQWYRNKSAPTGTLANSGWQYEGMWGGFTGTAIGSRYFITAEHVGGSVGMSFIYRGVTYTTTNVCDDPTSDL